MIFQRFNISFNRSVIKIYFFFLPLNVFFAWIFYYVYILVSSQPQRSIEELIKFSPRIQQIISGTNPNGGGQDGAIFHSLYKFLRLDNHMFYSENMGLPGGGLGIFLPLLFIIVIIANIFVTKTIKDYSWIIAVLLAYLYFAVFGNNISLHSYLFNIIPGFNSIRIPIRYVIFVGYAAIFMLFYYFDKIMLNSKKYSLNTLIIVLLLLVLVDQQRSSFKGWDRENFINTELMATKLDVKKNCDYFYYDKPGGWWHDQIEALSFAVQIGVPTVNGYSGGFPPNYPSKPWNYDAPSLEIFDWMNQIEIGKRGCLILGNSNIRNLSDLSPSLDFYGFTEEEGKDSSNWRWAVSKQSYILILGQKGSRKELEFEINGAPCFDKFSLEVSLLGANLSILNGLVDGKQKVSLPIEMGERGAEILKFTTEVEACKILGDPRDLFFEIKNLKLI